MIELAGVTKSYEDRRVLGPVTLTLPAGQTSVLIGPSGCGKSTLLRMLLGLVHPEAGSIKVSGTLVQPDTVIAIRRKVGYVIQDGGLFPHLTAYGNITLLAQHLGLSKIDRRQRLQTLCDLAKFSPSWLDRFPPQLSGGQKQRVGLMRALMLDPAILLLDEPLGALDPLIRFEMQQDLKEIFARLKKTVVMVTHDMAEASYLGDRIVLLKAGTVVQEGTPRAFVERPATEFVRRFMRAQRSLHDGEVS